MAEDRRNENDAESKKNRKPDVPSLQVFLISRMGADSINRDSRHFFGLMLKTIVRPRLIATQAQR
jgi:hypothetical protein